MKYSIDIERSIWALTRCLNKVKNGICNIEDWNISVNAGGIDYGIYFNFDIGNKELEICNQPGYEYDDSLYLEDIIKTINEEYGEDNEYDE